MRLQWLLHKTFLLSLVFAQITSIPFTTLSMLNLNMISHSKHLGCILNGNRYHIWYTEMFPGKINTSNMAFREMRHSFTYSESILHGSPASLLPADRVLPSPLLFWTCKFSDQILSNSPFELPLLCVSTYVFLCLCHLCMYLYIQMYPALPISHVEESKRPVTIPSWCKRGWGHCQTHPHIIVPYRCLGENDTLHCHDIVEIQVQYKHLDWQVDFWHAPFISFQRGKDITQNKVKVTSLN